MGGVIIAVLAHAAVQVIVTHGGASSIAEAVNGHVDMLIIRRRTRSLPQCGTTGREKAHCVSLDHRVFLPEDMKVGIERLQQNETVIER